MVAAPVLVGATTMVAPALELIAMLGSWCRCGWVGYRNTCRSRFAGHRSRTSGACDVFMLGVVVSLDRSAPRPRPWAALWSFAG
jgi:hypothetical protein